MNRKHTPSFIFILTAIEIPSLCYCKIVSKNTGEKGKEAMALAMNGKRFQLLFWFDTQNIRIFQYLRLQLKHGLAWIGLDWLARKAEVFSLE